MLILPSYCPLLCSNVTYYDKGLRPFFGTYQPVVVDIMFRVNHLLEVNAKQSLFTLGLFVKERWLDPRLVYNNRTIVSDIGDPALRVDAEMIWVPDTGFYNTANRCNSHHDIVSVFSNGTVSRRRQMSCTFFNVLDFHHFPFDRNSYTMEFISFADSSLALSFRSNQCFSPPEDMEATFARTIYRLESALCNSSTMFVGLFDIAGGAGGASLSASLTLSRRTEHYILKFIMPLFMLGFLSCSTFWIGEKTSSV